MTKKTISVIIHEEDTRKLMMYCVGFCLERFNARHNIAINNLNQLLNEGTKEEIAEAMNKLVNNTASLIEDLQETLIVADQLDPSGSADT
jgi:hypothetical protein